MRQYLPAKVPGEQWCVYTLSYPLTHLQLYVHICMCVHSHICSSARESAESRSRLCVWHVCVSCIVLCCWATLMPPLMAEYIMRVHKCKYELTRESFLNQKICYSRRCALLLKLIFIYKSLRVGRDICVARKKIFSFYLR